MGISQHLLIIGGTGFLGYHAVQECLNRGWQVTALGLPPAPPPGLFPETVQVLLQDIAQTSDQDLLDLLAGHQALVFAAGLDDRAIQKRPAYPAFEKANVEMPRRVLTLARQAGVQRAVVLGSYFCHFHRLHPEWRLAERHPYIRSRLEQERVATSIPGLEVSVLELPYIFGSYPVPGWKPLWLPLVRYLRSSKIIFFMKGGTACITARTAGRAIAAALERGGSKCYPIGQENLTWSEMLIRIGLADGRRVRVVNLPSRLVRLGTHGLWLLHHLQGLEHGLDPRHYAAIQTSETFIDPSRSQSALGYELDELDEAFEATVRVC
ncbi:MAG: NAD(P)H-binding protein [Anaerolineales bacterium]|nr:NAD(P)H-binding protein [Anaerolineales bacterium]